MKLLIELKNKDEAVHVVEITPIHKAAKCNKFAARFCLTSAKGAMLKALEIYLIEKGGKI